MIERSSSICYVFKGKIIFEKKKKKKKKKMTFASLISTSNALIAPIFISFRKRSILSSYKNSNSLSFEKKKGWLEFGSGLVPPPPFSAHSTLYPRERTFQKLFNFFVRRRYKSPGSEIKGQAKKYERKVHIFFLIEIEKTS